MYYLRELVLYVFQKKIELYTLKHEFDKQIEEEKIKRIIKIHALLDFELVFKYQTYKMIVNDEI